jgi:hypothetical protein
VVLEVTAQSGGKEIYRAEKHYHTQATTCRDNKMIYGAQFKTQYIRDTSLQPYQIKDETFEINLPAGIRAADVSVALIYEINKPGNKIEIHRVNKQVSLDR